LPTFFQNIDAKLKLLEIYNWKLDRRAERRKFVLERGLHDLKKVTIIFFFHHRLSWFTFASAEDVVSDLWNSCLATNT
jgi:hypothetical protein